MKILSIAYNDIWPWGKNKGIPSIFYPQKGFVERGHEVFFLCPQRDPLQLKEEDSEGIKIFRFRLPFGLHFQYVNSLPLKPFFRRIKATVLSNLTWYSFAVYSLFFGLRLARRIKPDIIYAHGLTPVFSAFLISRLVKAKLVIRVYGVKDLYFNRDKILYRIKEFRNYLAFKIPAEYFIFTNDGTEGDLLAKEMGVPEYKIKSWRNGVDFQLPEISPDSKTQMLKRLNLAPGTKIILSTCRLIPLYGMKRTFSMVFDILKEEKNAAFLIAGDGPLRDEIERPVVLSEEYQRIRFLGTVDHEKIKELLLLCDIFVFLPPYHNCTNTMWEAMTAGACIVTTQTGPIEKVLKEKEAILIPLKEEYLAKDIMIDLLHQDEMRKNLGESVLRKARGILEAWPERVEKEVKLLEELAEIK